ncbi:MAG: MBL fold metallo-hydrolase [Candidatus Woesearchaeota archaeon]
MKVIVIKEGIHTTHEPRQGYIARIDPICSSVTLIKAEKDGEKNILVDTGYHDYEDEILEGLKKEGLNPEDIHYVINTHEHFDHCINNHLFTNAAIIVGQIRWNPDRSIDVYRGIEDIHIQKGVNLISTPGHKFPHVSVFIEADKKYVVAGDTITKDFFMTDYETEEKIASAKKVLDMADIIIPGHGPLIYKKDFEHVHKRIAQYEQNQNI